MGLPRRIVGRQLSELRYDSSIVQMFHYLTDFQLSTQLCCPWLANGLPLLPLSTACFTLYCCRECECEIRRQDKLQRRNTNKNSKMLSSIKEQCNRERERGRGRAHCSSSSFTPENFISAIRNWAQAKAMAKAKAMLKLRVNYGLN